MKHVPSPCSVVFVTGLIGITACQDDGEYDNPSAVVASDIPMNDVSDPLVEEVVDSYLDQGINCTTAETFGCLTGEQQDGVIEDLLQAVGEDGMQGLLDIGGGCNLDEREVAIEREPIPESWEPQENGTALWGTSTYTVEFIEKSTGSSGTTPNGIYSDSSLYGWMCNSGTAESFPDYIGVTNVSGAYSSRSTLRVRPQNLNATLYLSSSNAARVYSNNDIAMCIGYWHVFLTGAVMPLLGDFKTAK